MVHHVPVTRCHCQARAAAEARIQSEIDRVDAAVAQEAAHRRTTVASLAGALEGLAARVATAEEGDER